MSAEIRSFQADRIADCRPLTDPERTAVLLGFLAGMLMCLPLEPPVAATENRGCDQATRLRVNERVIIALVASGHSNKEIGRELGITPETLQFHLKRISRKLNVHRRAEAVVRAQGVGLFWGIQREGSPLEPAPLLGRARPVSAGLSKPGYRRG